MVTGNAAPISALDACALRPAVLVAIVNAEHVVSATAARVQNRGLIVIGRIFSIFRASPRKIRGRVVFAPQLIVFHVRSTSRSRGSF
jgi:hypothetical protein